MAYEDERFLNPAIAKDNQISISSFRTPGTALEHRTVTSTGVTFSTALKPDILYSVVSLGGPSMMSLNGVTPTQATGSLLTTVGIPLSENLPFIFCPISGSQTALRVTAMSGAGGYSSGAGGSAGANTTNVFLSVVYPTGSIAGI